MRREKMFVPWERRDVHRHLLAICHEDPLFAIFDPQKDVSLERLAVFDGQKLKEANSDQEARHAVIGTVRLLPAGSGTMIIFDEKDAVWRQEITEEGKALFRKFIQRVQDHFAELPKMMGKDGASGGEAPAASRPPWFPKKSETLKKWEEAYSAFVELREEYRRRYADLDTDDPNPKIGDYRDAIRGRYSEKTVGRILKVGDSGWLE